MGSELGGEIEVTMTTLDHQRRRSVCEQKENTQCDHGEGEGSHDGVVVDELRTRNWPDDTTWMVVLVREQQEEKELPHPTGSAFFSLPTLPVVKMHFTTPEMCR
jgi:hypothetical protein